MLYNIISLKTLPETIFAHIYSCPNYRADFMPTVSNIEIAYIESGPVLVEILGKQITAEEKSFLVLLHNHKISLATIENQSHIHYTVSSMVGGDSKVTEGLPEELPEKSLCVPVYLPYCKHTESLRQLLNLIIKEYQSSDGISSYKCGALVTELLCDIARASKNLVYSDKKSVTDVLSAKIKKYIQNNLDKKITLSDIAECTGKNPNYINQVFQQKNNMPIIKYVNLMKMKRVASLIIDNKLTLKEAAKEVGISDGNYISRLFKSTMGMTVSEYKEYSADNSVSFSDFEKIN